MSTPEQLEEAASLFLKHFQAQEAVAADDSQPGAQEAATAVARNEEGGQAGSGAVGAVHAGGGLCHWGCGCGWLRKAAGAPGAAAAAALSRGDRGTQGCQPPACVSWVWHLWPLMWRETLIMVRNPADVAGRVLTYTWCVKGSRLPTRGMFWGFRA